MTQLYLDIHTRTPTDPAWALGGAVASASMLLREDVRRQLPLCRDEAGIRFVRAGGWWADDMAAARADGTFDFTNVERALAGLMESYIAPFIDLSDAPAAVATDAGRWPVAVEALARMIDGRYGCDAREWYLLVADLSGLGTDDAERRREHLLRFDRAARSIKDVHPEFRVGAVVPASPDGLDTFLAHVAGPSAEYGSDLRRCDFVVARPVLSGAAAAEELATVRRRVTETLGEHVPVLFDGWRGDEPDVSDPHDACARAATLCQTAAAVESVVQGATFAPCSDIAAGGALRFEPFHGAPGILTVNEVRKASFNAFRLLGAHRGYHSQRIASRWEDPIPGLGCLASIEEYTLRLLSWYAAEPGGTPTAPARFTIEGLAPGVHMAQVEIIRPKAGSPYEAWLELGRPPFINREVLDTLEIASQPAMAEVDFREYPPRLESGMVMQLTIPLPFDEPWTD